jgi:hypothetical protein
MLKHVIIGIGMALSFSLPAGARAEEAAASGKQVAPNHNVGDPNERICENITPIGSRLATKRFCGTRSEWADRKRQDREALEAAQKGPCQITTTGATGRPSC